MRAAHRLGMSTTATMMWGHVETLDERIEHLRRIRELQDEMHGFRAFISWTFQPDNTELAQQVSWFPTSFDYLLMQAVSRIYLDNVDHIQSSWVTQGMKVGQVALFYGADDLGSIMIEENVVSAAGTTYRAGVDDFLHTIRNAGFRPSPARHALPHGARLPAGRGGVPHEGVGDAADPRRAPAGVGRDRRPAPAREDAALVGVADRGARERRDRLRGVGDGQAASGCWYGAPASNRPGGWSRSGWTASARARTEFVIEPDGDGSRVTVTAELHLPMLVGAVARGPIEHGLKQQLEGLEREAAE